MKWIGRPVAEIWPFEIFLRWRRLPCFYLFEPENSTIRSAVPENPTPEPNMEWIGSPVAEIWLFAYLGAYGIPVLGEGEVVGGQRWHHSKER